MRFGVALWCAVCLVCGCGDKSAVTLSAAISNVTVASEPGVLGASATGSFDLVLTLGPEAPRAATVTLGNFSLQNEAGAALIDPLPVDASGTAFPLDVNKGESKTVAFTLHVTKVLSADERQALCAGKVRIVGTVMDTLSGGTDPAQSAPVTPSCP